MASPSQSPGWEKDHLFPVAQTRNLGALSALFAYPTQISPALSPSLGLGNCSLLSDSISLPCYPGFSHQWAGSEPLCSDQLPPIVSPHSCHSNLPKVRIQSCRLLLTPLWLPIAVTRATCSKRQAGPFMVWCVPLHPFVVVPILKVSTGIELNCCDGSTWLQTDILNKVLKSDRPGVESWLWCLPLM